MKPKCDSDIVLDKHAQRDKIKTYQCFLITKLLQRDKQSGNYVCFKVM